MPRSTRGPTGENAGAAAGAGGGVGPPKVYPDEKSESATLPGVAAPPPHGYFSSKFIYYLIYGTDNNS